MPTDNDFDARKHHDEPKQISRRALLKELSKAPGVMGALMIPGSWVAPLMEFTLLSRTNPCSATTGNCTGTALALPFGNSGSVSWSATWYGLIQGTAISAVLDAPNKTVTVTATTPFTAGSIASAAVAPDASVGAQSVGWAFAGGNATTTAITLSVTAPNGTLGTACSTLPYTLGQDKNIYFSMDLVLTGSQAAGYTLLVKNFHSSNC